MSLEKIKQADANYLLRRRFAGKAGGGERGGEGGRGVVSRDRFSVGIKSTVFRRHNFVIKRKGEREDRSVRD